MLDTINVIILVLLGIITIRQLIASNFDIPLPPHWKWILYDKKSLEPPVLCRRTYEMAEDFNNLSQSKKIIFELLTLGSNHATFFPDGLIHGRSPAGINSKYFINTLEASYNDKDLSVMTTGIRKLIKESGLVNRIDFVLCLKTGNQILARNIFQSGKRVIHICKIDGDSSYSPVRPNDPRNGKSLEYENLKVLIQAASQSPEKLYGIAIDCSVSSGVGLQNAIVDFNKMITDLKLNVRPIQHAFVLYCHQDFSNRDPWNNCFHLHRFFDMNEDIRKMIYEKGGNGGEDNWEYSVYRQLKDKKLLR